MPDIIKKRIPWYLAAFVGLLTMRYMLSGTLDIEDISLAFIGLFAIFCGNLILEAICQAFGFLLGRLISLLRRNK